MALADLAFAVNESRRYHHVRMLDPIQHLMINLFTVTRISSISGSR
jgi:hypothetical protein